jgi:ssDNA-binding Zn-finger/Zn-ribbon topoisomerase 1
MAKIPKGFVPHTCPKCGWTSYQLPSVTVWCGNKRCSTKKGASYQCEVTTTS